MALPAVRRGPVLIIAVTLLGGLFAVLPARTAAADPPYTFVRDGYALWDVPASLLPYNTATAVARPPADSGCHDATGVRMYCGSTGVFNHPVNQAQYGLALLNGYRLTGAPIYLDYAQRQAQRLVDTKVVSRDGWFYPYPFSFDKHSMPSERMVTPWYSAMAQGQALSLFTRLAQTTGNAAWRTAADATFASFLAPRDATEPWVVFRDAAGYLWLEEYAQPRQSTPAPDRTINGHIYALYGLYDYFRLTGNADARLMYDGAITTMRAYFTALRRTAWISKYCLSHGTPAKDYHVGVTYQMLDLYRMTHHVRFAQYADSLDWDYPYYRVQRTARMQPKVLTGYKFSTTGGIVAKKVYTLTRASSAPVSQRIRIRGRSGYYLFVTAGIWANYYVQEAYTNAYIPGYVDPIRYQPPRTATFAAGQTYTGYRVTSAGSVTGKTTYRFSRTSYALASQRVGVNGGTYVQIANGLFAGMIVPNSVLPVH